jgi:transcriptional regulator
MVQARGRLMVVDESTWLHALVTRLTDTHEAGQARPWAVTDAPDDYVASMLRAIVGIEIELTSLQGKWKVSQNRADADRAGVARALSEQTGEQAQTMAMQVRAPGAA